MKNLFETKLYFTVEMYNLGTGAYKGFILRDWDDYETFMQDFNPYGNDCEIQVVTVDEIGTHADYYNFSIKQLIDIVEMTNTVGEFEKFDMLVATADCLEDAIDAYKNEKYYTFSGCSTKIEMAYTHAEEWGVFTDIEENSIIRQCFDIETYIRDYIESEYTVGKFNDGLRPTVHGIQETTYTYILINNNN